LGLPVRKLFASCVITPGIPWLAYETACIKACKDKPSHVGRRCKVASLSFSQLSPAAWKFRGTFWNIPRQTYSAQLCGQDRQVTERVPPVFQWKFKDGGHYVKVDKEQRISQTVDMIAIKFNRLPQGFSYMTKLIRILDDVTGGGKSNIPEHHPATDCGALSYTTHAPTESS
jgi:hypothetical protein